jgi:hypothetical protein
MISRGVRAIGIFRHVGTYIIRLDTPTRNHSPKDPGGTLLFSISRYHLFLKLVYPSAPAGILYSVSSGQTYDTSFRTLRIASMKRVFGPV